MVMDERPQDMQEFIHEDTNSLHASERIFGPPLQMRIEPGKMRIVLEQAQTSIVQQGAQTRSTLMRQGSSGRPYCAAAAAS